MGSSIERYRASADRVRAMRDQLLDEHGLREDEFELACRLLDDPGFRDRVVAIASNPGLAKIREQWDRISEENIERVEATCQGCESPGAVYRRRPIGVYCDLCVERSHSRPSTPPRHGIRSALSRARRAGVPATLTEEEWAEAVAHFQDRCGLCGGPWSIVEHATSISLGGGTTADNCYPACVPCNTAKRSTMLEHIGGDGPERVLSWLRSKGRSRGGLAFEQMPEIEEAG